MPSRIYLLFVWSFLNAAAVTASADPPDAPKHPTAWGKPQAGLQAGLRSHAERLEAVGATPLAIDVVVRNVAHQPIELSYTPPDSFGYAQEGTTVSGAHVAQRQARTTARLQPGGVLVVGTMRVGYRRPKRNSLIDERPFWIDLDEGLFQVGCDNVLGGDGLRTPKLATGYMDVKVHPDQ
jgi:hypothetical protein